MSSKDIDDASFVAPKIETFEPIRAKLRIDSVEPKVKKSMTDSDAPRRAKLRREKVDPR